MSRTLSKNAVIATGLASLCATLAGCGLAVTSTGTSTPPANQGVALHGRVYGGQQPLVSATVYLYAAGNTGYGSASTAYAPGSSLLGNHVVTTDSGGNFNITGDYSCPSPTTEVYIEAVGGIADGVPGDANPNVIMLAALGPCGNLSSASYITMNELTTIASVWALAPFMTGPTNIGTQSTNIVGLTNAFSSVNTLVNVQYGQLNTTSLPAGATIPTAELNTLGNILAACVNQAKGGVAGDGSNCGLLFTYATPSGGTAPTSTLMAALDIALNPGNNAAKIWLLAGKYAQFGPSTLSKAPTDWTVSIRYTGNANLSTKTVPTGIAADQSGNIWITNNGTVNRAGTAYTTAPSLVELSPTGAFMQSQSEAAYLGVAIDLNGNAWTAFNYINKTTSGTPGTTTSVSTTQAEAGGLTAGDIPGLAVDGSGNVWATSGSALTEFTSAGVAISPSTGYTGGGISSPASIAITPQ